MQNFEFQCDTKIIFGKGTQSRVGELTASYSKNVLLVYGGNSIKRIGLFDNVLTSLKNNGVTVTELGGVVANPRVSLIRKGIEIVREKNIDFILAVGGGSVIDTAKGIGLGALYDGDVWDIYCQKAFPDKMLPVGCVLTIPAAGSESSDSNVVTNEDTLEKNAYGHPCMRPRFAIMNPELTFSLPNYQTACGGMDIMAHIMERYFTNEKFVETSDRICEGMLKTMIHNVPIALKENDNYNARAEIMWMGSIAHNGFNGMGRIEEWTNHGMEHQLSALYDIAHGAGLAIMFPAWMKFVVKKNPDKLIQFAREVFNIDYNYYSPILTAYAGIEALENYIKSTGLATRLSEVNIGDENIEKMADMLTHGGKHNVGSYVSLTKQDVMEIYKLAL